MTDPSGRDPGGEAEQPKPPVPDQDRDDAIGPRGPLRAPSAPFPIVGIGASAGGLEAITRLLAKLPADSGMAFLLVQHLDPRRESRLPELLGRASELPVLEARHGLPVAPDHAYVITPNTNLGLASGLLHITPRGEGGSPHAPIDYLFRSIAVDQQERSIAVVLSGTGSDGTQGVCEVKAVGGITFAQDQTTAVQPGMPHSAVASGCIDFVLAPEQIAERLTRLGKHPYVASAKTIVDRGAADDDSADRAYRSILSTTRAVTGVDFSLYRDSTIRRRIMRRMALRSQSSLAEYAKELQDDHKEVEALYHDLLINVTSFFRDPELFEALKNSVFPTLAEGKSAAEPFRIWVPGCSTGQEAYSLAMSLIEFYDGEPATPPIQIFATDLTDQTALAKARAGLYPEGIENEVSPERLRRFFRREDHHYRIQKSIRDLCVFARQNVTTDPPFSNLDLISCRNLLIYLQAPLQRRILPMFHYALGVPGFLVLGSSETVGDYDDLFELQDRQHRIHLKRTAVSSRRDAVFSLPHDRSAYLGGGKPGRHPGPTLQDFQREADLILLGRYAPPGVLVNRDHDVLQYRGHTSAYLEAPPGEPTTNVLKLAREGLFSDLRNALAEAARLGQRVRREGVRVRTDGKLREIALEVLPVRPLGREAHYLILFLEEQSPEPKAQRLSDAAPPISESEAQADLVQVRKELVATREYLQSMVEQQDAANEELRSANEEVLSSNEELQSTNEELDTAREELQSLNEELTTVNEQLQRRNQELDQLNNDLTNLISSTTIPVAMIGADLRIRRVTPTIKKVMNLGPSDVGRSVRDIQLGAISSDIVEVIGQVVDSVQPVERELQDRDGRWYQMRVHPYRTADRRIDGVVLTLVDIHERRLVQDALQRHSDSQRQQGLLVELSQDAIIVRDHENRVLSWNRGAQDVYGWSTDEALGKPLDQLLRPDPDAWTDLNRELDENGAWEGELHQSRRDGSPVVVHSREVLVRGDDGTRLAVLAIKRDVTELKRMIEALRRADHRKDEFLAMLAHELRNPLAPIRNATEIMRRSGEDPAAVARVQELLDRQVRQLSRIVEDLVDVARIVERKIELRKEPVTMATLVDTAVETSRSLVEGYGHDLTVQLPDEELVLVVDPVRISQVLSNLLNNAAKFTEPGGKIWLSAERDGRSAGHGEVIVRVRDNGVGIAAEDLPAIFEIFAQGRQIQNQVRSGLGVGLSLVRSLVQMHGGSVTAESAGPARGSQFEVRLPLADPSERLPELREDSEAHLPAMPLRVLVVDDSTDQAQSLGTLLELMGHTVRVAFTGPQALEVAADFRPQVALVDIGLPGMTGYEVARRLRRQQPTPDLLLVAQTGWGQRQDQRRSRQAGFDHHLVKPIDVHALENILRSRARLDSPPTN